MASILIDAIPEQNFELVRDQIGTIIKEEITQQAILQPTEDALKNVSVFVDRLVMPNKSELPLINVFLDLGNFDNQDVEAQDGTYSFNIDFYFSGKSGANESRGDVQSLRNLQRLMGVVRAIIQSVKYVTLGFAKPSVMHRSIESLLITDPTVSQDGSNISQGRLTLKVRMVETAEMFVPSVLNESLTKVKISDTEKGFEYEIIT